MRALMDKFLFLVKTYIKTYMRYPLSVFFKLVELPFQIFIYIFLWYYIFNTSEINYRYMVTYYLITGLLNLAYPFIHIAVDIEKDVFEGAIANCLVRPYHYILPRISKFCAWMCIYSIIYIPALIFVYFYNNISITQIVLFCLCSIIGMFVEFMMWFTFGLLALITPKIRGLLRIIAAFRVILSGALIPLSYMPDFMQQISKYMPFEYYIYVPVNALLSTQPLTQIKFNLAASLFWIIFFAAASKMIWKKAIPRLETNIS